MEHRLDIIIRDIAVNVLKRRNKLAIFTQT